MVETSVVKTSVVRTSANEGYMGDGERRWSSHLAKSPCRYLVWAICREDSNLEVKMKFQNFEISEIWLLEM
jgi:hypothetical protein